MKFRFIFIGFLVGVLSSLLLFYAYPTLIYTCEIIDLGYAVKKTHHNGEKIVAAIESYYEKNGRYPDCLAQLLPEYLPEIPPSFFDVREWYYYRTSEDYFLGASITYPACHYVPSDKKWRIEY